MFNNRDVSCKKYIVAVIDILGAKNLIMSSVQEDSLRNLHFVYDFTLKFNNNFDIKIFSDNIVIAKIIQEEQDENLLSITIHNFFVFVGDYQWHLLNLGYLSRGGITLGDFYIDDTIVWGKALVQAHEIEEHKAIFPRVIIDGSILNIYEQPKDRISRLAKDVDGSYYIDYLTYNLDCELTKFPYILDIIKAKAAEIEDEHIKKKYDWYENYHRNVYENYNITDWKDRWGKNVFTIIRQN